MLTDLAEGASRSGCLLLTSVRASDEPERPGEGVRRGAPQADNCR